MVTVEELRNKIKDFTQKSPNVTDSFNPEYKEYLAKCAKLLEIDFELSSLDREDKDEYYYQSLEEIHKKIGRLIKI